MSYQYYNPSDYSSSSQQNQANRQRNTQAISQYLSVPTTPSSGSSSSPVTPVTVSFTDATSIAGISQSTFYTPDLFSDLQLGQQLSQQPPVEVIFQEPKRTTGRRSRHGSTRPSQQGSLSREREFQNFDFPGPRAYPVGIPATMSNPQTMSQTEREQLINSLKTHRINTLTELRRIEKAFSYANDRTVNEALTTAWAHYVNSNNLLNELRALTKSYPFSSECLDESKWKVIEDSASSRSWNYCWLVLVKIQQEGLISKYASWMANKPEMWGNRTPTAPAVSQLAHTLASEWTRALNQMLRHWEYPPTAVGQ